MSSSNGNQDLLTTDKVSHVEINRHAAGIFGRERVADGARLSK